MDRYEAEDRPLSVWRTYSLKKCESLNAVAARHGLTLGRLKQLNGIGLRMKVGPGFSLLVPDKNAKQVSMAVIADLPKAPGPPPRKARAYKKGKKPVATRGKQVRKAAPKPSAKKKAPPKKKSQR